MATKQDIDKGHAVHLAGTVPAGHCLAPIRQALLEHPRERQWVIGEVVSATTTIKHPADGADQRAPTMEFVELVAITDDADCDQLAAMAKRARHVSPPPGQQRLGDGEDD